MNWIWSVWHGEFHKSSSKITLKLILEHYIYIYSFLFSYWYRPTVINTKTNVIFFLLLIFVTKSGELYFTASHQNAKVDCVCMSEGWVYKFALGWM